MSSPRLKPPAWDQQALANVRMAAEVYVAHPAGLVEMSEGAFQALPAESQQAQTARAPNTATIAVYRVACFGVLLPVPSSPIGFRDVAAKTDGFEIDERLIAVIALVADDLVEAVTVGPHRLDLLGRV